MNDTYVRDINLEIKDYFNLTDKVEPVEVRNTGLFEVFLTPLNLPLDEFVLGIDYGNLSRALRSLITACSVDHQSRTVTFDVVKGGSYDLAFIKALQTPGVKEILIYQYKADGSLLHTIAVTVIDLVDYTLVNQKEVEQENNNITQITVEALVDFRVK